MRHDVACADVRTIEVVTSVLGYVTDAHDTFVRDMVRGKELYNSVGAHGSGYPTRHLLESPISDAGPYAFQIKRLVAEPRGWSLGSRSGSLKPPR